VSKFVSTYVLPYLKAHYAAFGTAVGMLLADLHGGWDFSSITSDQVLAMLAGAGLVGGGTAALRNRPAPFNPESGLAQDDEDAPAADAAVAV